MTSVHYELWPSIQPSSNGEYKSCYISLMAWQNWIGVGRVRMNAAALSVFLILIESAFPNAPYGSDDTYIMHF